MPTAKELRFRVEYALVRAATSALRILPIDVGVAAAACLAAWIAPWTSLHARALRNLAAAFPEWPEAELKRVVAAMWRNTGRTIAEVVLLDRIASDSSRLEILGQDIVDQGRGHQAAIIAITLHLGNWEMFGVFCGAQGFRLTGVYRPFRNPYIDGYMRKLREPFYGGGMVGRRKSDGIGLSGGAASSKLLRNGGMLGLVCDQVDHTCAFTVPFFRHRSQFTPAPAVFARSSGGQIWIARCLRRGPKSRFLVEIKELLVARSSDRAADIRETTAAMALQFEQWIRETPEQWMWWQRRSISG